MIKPFFLNTEGINWHGICFVFFIGATVITFISVIWLPKIPVIMPICKIKCTGDSIWESYTFTQFWLKRWDLRRHSLESQPVFIPVERKQSSPALRHQRQLFSAQRRKKQVWQISPPNILFPWQATENSFSQFSWTFFSHLLCLSSLRLKINFSGSDSIRLGCEHTGRFKIRLSNWNGMKAPVTAQVVKVHESRFDL